MTARMSGLPAASHLHGRRERGRPALVAHLLGDHAQHELLQVAVGRKALQPGHDAALR
jgi:hypothetical protein